MKSFHSILLLQDTPATQLLAAAAAESWPLHERPVIFLSGDLGSGKTTWARAFIHALGWTGPVPSPTYTLIEHYPVAQGNVAHVDLYRLSSPLEAESLGLRELHGEVLLLLEWPSKGRGFLPRPDMLLRFAWHPHGRVVRMRSFSNTGKHMIKAMAARHHVNRETAQTQKRVLGSSVFDS
mgnify:CR=1 FL=1